ncbi:MAG: hypothetical protein AAFR16_10180 [Pseudomonadota bacterium]
MTVRTFRTRFGAGAPLCAAGWLVACAALAQAPGGMSARVGVQQAEAESRALYEVGRRGGDLMPKDTVRRCEDDGTVRLGAAPSEPPGALPKSLLDEERARTETSTIILGGVTVLCR